MRALVIGGGVIGVSTAHYLAREGHDVTVIERAPGLAQECSHAPTGQIASGHCSAWASPSAPGILLRSLFRPHQALELRLRSIPALMDWGIQFLRECTSARFMQNSLAKLHLCLYSARQYAALCNELTLDFDRRDGGILFLHRDADAFENATRNIGKWIPHGLELNVVRPDEMTALEPSLAGKRDRFVGAIFSARDGSGDAAAFTQALSRCPTPGTIEFRFNERVLALDHQGDRIEAVTTDQQVHKADFYIVASGWESTSLCAPLGMELPIYPVKGCSATFTVRDPEKAAQRGLIDEHNLVGIARLGNRMRFAGRAIFDLPNTDVVPRDFSGIEAVAAELYGDALDLEAKRLWACLRPMTPDGPPIIGATPYSNLFLNTGHGHIGWTMACGSAALLSQLINKQKPDLDLEKYSARRYWH